MARMVMHRTPVVVYVPEIDAHVSAYRGVEFADDDPICRDPNLQWLFDDEPEPPVLDSVPVEQATAAPGERRATRRR